MRAAVCALKYSAYAMGYLAMGATADAERCSTQARRLGDTATDATLPIANVIAEVLIAEYSLAKLDAQLVD